MIIIYDDATNEYIEKIKGSFSDIAAFVSSSSYSRDDKSKELRVYITSHNQESKIDNKKYSNTAIILSEEVKTSLELSDKMLVNPLAFDSSIEAIVNFINRSNQEFEATLEFLSHEVHDLGGTLNQISGYAQLLMVSENLNDEDREFAETCTNASNTLDEQIQVFRTKLIKHFS
jgi:signal transduction histidine kinase